MRLKERKVLGVSLEERSAVVAELRLARGERYLERAEEFQFPEGLSWAEPIPLGKALGQFLRQHRFSSKRAVLGLPAKWLLSKEVRVPPSSPATTAGIVRMQAERELSPDPAELTLDYTDEGDPQSARQVLLVAARRDRLVQVAAMAHAARIGVLSVTSSALAVAEASAPADASRVITMIVRPQVAELTVRAGRQFLAVRHMPVMEMAQTAAGAASFDSLSATLLSEARRAEATVSVQPDENRITRLLVWDGVGLPDTVAAGLNSQRGLEVKVRSKLSEIGVHTPAAGGDEVRALPAAALAMAAIDGHRPCVDLLHSRLAAAPRKLLTRRTVGVGVAVVFAAAAILALVVVWRGERNRLAGVTAQIAGMKDQIDSAKLSVERIAATKGWYEDRPRVLDCLREVSLAFPVEGRSWVTGLSIKPAPPAKPAPGGKEAKTVEGLLTVKLTGKARDQKAAQDTIDRLGKSKTISDLKQGPIIEASRVTRDVTFAVNFNYVLTE